MTGEELIKILKKNGWVLKDIRGSHHQMLNPATGQKIPVPCKRVKDLKKGTIEGILKQAGLRKHF
jgi:predicted RNA binding protein YcfA (HicA-like mRNA interferase family)